MRGSTNGRGTEQIDGDAKAVDVVLDPCSGTNVM